MSFFAKPILPQALDNRKALERACKELDYPRPVETAVVETTKGPYMLQGAGVAALEPGSYVRFGGESRSSTQEPLTGSVLFTATSPRKWTQVAWAASTALAGSVAALAGAAVVLGELAFTQAAQLSSSLPEGMPLSARIIVGAALMMAGVVALGPYARAMLRDRDANLGNALCDAVGDPSRKLLMFEQISSANSEEELRAPVVRPRQSQAAASPPPPADFPVGAVI